MLWHALRILILCFSLLPAAWAGGTLALVLSDNSAPFREFSTTLGESLRGSTWKISQSGTIDTLNQGPPPDLIVTAGIDGFRQSLARGGETPILATLIPRTAFEKMLAESGRTRRRISAIYIEQPLPRQIAFLRQILPGNTVVGVLLSDESQSKFPLLKQTLLKNGYQLETETVETQENLLPATHALLARVQFLLATPDATIYRRDNIKPLLMSSYRHHKPVIAFSSAFVSAGALAALYASPEQIARQTAEIILSHGSALPLPEFPTSFSIAINRNVAEALNVKIGSESDIRRALSGTKEAP